MRLPDEQRANTPKRISFGGASPGHMNPLRSSENQHRDRDASAAQYANPLRYNDPENR